MENAEECTVHRHLSWDADRGVCSILWEEGQMSPAPDRATHILSQDTACDNTPCPKGDPTEHLLPAPRR